MRCIGLLCCNCKCCEHDMNKFSVARYSHKGVHFCMSDLKLAPTNKYVISTIHLWIRHLYAIKDCFRNTRVRIKCGHSNPQSILSSKGISLCAQIKVTPLYISFPNAGLYREVWLHLCSSIASCPAGANGSSKT